MSYWSQMWLPAFESRNVAEKKFCGKISITIDTRDAGTMHGSGSNHPFVFNRHKALGSIDVAHHTHLGTHKKKA